MPLHDIGEKPGKGRYCCTNCGWRVVLDDDSDRLPPYGNCGKGQEDRAVTAADLEANGSVISSWGGPSARGHLVTRMLTRFRLRVGVEAIASGGHNA